MNINDAQTMARELMNQHGLGHVAFGWHRKTREFGTCMSVRVSIFDPWTVKMIMLSSRLAEVNPVEQVRDTILHEIAHALVGTANGHNSIWRAKARELGCNDSPCCGADVQMAPGKFTASCPCGRAHEFYRMPTRGKRCATCHASLEIHAR